MVFVDRSPPVGQLSIWLDQAGTRRIETLFVKCSVIKCWAATGCRFHCWSGRAQCISQIQIVVLCALPMTGEVRMGTESSRERESLEEQSSARGTTSRIRTETAARQPKRRCTVGDWTLCSKSTLVCCVIFARVKLRNGGPEAAAMPFRAYYRAMIV